ncbi:MAG TPA: hypothetical protein VMA83_06050 [Solirubrobacteraceae bacterium]|nr:hypothetical protein [Solirubrobacteraceae bacterium]
MASENLHNENETEAAPVRGDASRPPLPSRGLTAALAAVMLGIGLALGVALGPGPATSFGIDAPLAALLRSLLAEHPAQHAKVHPASGTTPATSTPTSGKTPATTSGEPTETTNEQGGGSGKNTPANKKAATKELPPINRVWLVELSGGGFSEALSSPSKAPYIDGQALHAGSYLSGWSALAASSFATSVAQIATSEPALVQTVVQPVCTSGEECAPGTPGGLAAADAFLAKTLPKLTSNSAYRSNGLIVVTFGTVAAGPETELPTGSTTSLLASEPPAGTLLVSPYVAAGKRPKTTFDPASPRGSMEALLSR